MHPTHVAADPLAAAHQAAREYWARCADTLAAPPDYYAVQEHVLRNAAMPLVGRAERALDIGCGDGYFSCVIAEHCREVLGLDLSPALIESARRLSLERGLGGARFAVHDVELPFPAEPAPLVACMGVLSTLIDDTAFLRLAVQLVTHTLPGGHLITKDTVCHGRAELNTSRQAPRLYRNANRYVATVMALGLELVGEFHLAKGSANRLNALWVWRAAKGK
jgi:2-polyprenyl-3-methyl-5-hydroxy-6-metoxy-1,4-benzoquinol methylase